MTKTLTMKHLLCPQKHDKPDSTNRRTLHTHHCTQATSTSRVPPSRPHDAHVSIQGIQIDQKLPGNT